MTAPVVSIVLPTFDRLELLRLAVGSVFDQTIREWELIIADDGSGPEVQAFLADLERDERVRVVRLAHSGNPGRVRNCAIEEARSRYVAFLDSDDLWEPNKLERQLAAMRDAPECGWSYTAFVIVDALGIPYPSERTRPWTPHAGQIFAEVVRGFASIRTPTVIARTELVREVGAFDVQMDCVEDYDLWTRLALQSPACVVDETLVRVRRHAANTPKRAGSAFDGRDYSLRKLAQQRTGAQRALLNAERMRNGLTRAAANAAAGERSRAVIALASSLRLGWSYPYWWYRTARILARACLGTRRSAHRQPRPP